MNDSKRINRFVRENLDVRAGDEAFRSLREAVLDAHRRRRKTPSAIPLVYTRRLIMKVSTTRIALAALICVAIGAAGVVAVSIGQYYYLGRDEGGHHFISDDGQSVVTMGDEDVNDVNQTQSDLQEMKSLSQQGQRELTRAVEYWANDHLERRLFIYKYRLSDGRTQEMGEAAPDNSGTYSLTDAQHAEMVRLKKAGPGEDLGTYEEDIQGRTFVFKKQQYILGDGTKILWSIGEPKNNGSQ